MPSGTPQLDRRSCVIVAGDNRELARYAGQLCAARWDVVAASDGEEAFEAALAWHADLVFSDATMPVLDGFGLLRRLRSHPATSDTPVILILSPHAGEEAWLESLDLGADDYLVKPFSVRALMARAEAHLRMVRTRRGYEQRAAADLEAMRLIDEAARHCVQHRSHQPECLTVILDAAIRIMGAEKGNLQLANPESGALEIAAQQGFEPPFLSFFASVTSGHPCARGAALRNQERVIVDDVMKSPLFAGRPSREVLLGAGVRSVVSMCLVSAEGALLGVLSTHFGTPRRPGERDLRLLDLLCRQASSYLEQLAAEQSLRRNHTELQARAEELERFNRLMVGRELRMIELKQEINSLCDLAGQPARYNVSGDAPQQTRGPDPQTGVWT